MSSCCVPGIVPKAEVTAVPMADKSFHSGVGRQTKARRGVRISGAVRERRWLLKTQYRGTSLRRGHWSGDMNNKGFVLE